MFSACENVSGSARPSASSERRLDPLHRDVVPAREEEEATELRRELRQIGVRLLLRQSLIRAVHALETLLRTASIPHDLREACFHAGCGMRLARVVEERDRGFEVRAGFLWPCADLRHDPCALVQIGLQHRIVCQVDRALVGVLRLFVGGERRCALGRAHEHLAGFVADRARIVVVRGGAVRVEIVRCEHLHDLFFVTE